MTESLKQGYKKEHTWKRYPKYKDSGVEWLGEVPEGWDVVKLGYKATVKARLGWKGLKAEEYQDEGYIFLSTPNIKNKSIDFINVNYINSDRYFESPEIILQKGDVLIVKDGSTLGITNVIRELPAPSTINSSIAVIRPKKDIVSLFLYYILTSEYTQNSIQLVKDGQGVPHLFQEDLRKFWIWVPSLPVQTAIATFLDRETARIDTLIEKKERLITLLEEKRSALISHAVTKGLDPSVKMKDSGVDWIGMVPEGWEIKRLKYSVDLMNVKIEALKEGTTYIGLENIEPWTGRFLSSEEKDKKEGQFMAFGEGNVLFCKLRPYLAKVLKTFNDGICTSELLVLQPKLVNQNFLFYFLLSQDFINIVDSSTYGSKMPRANWDFIGNLPCLIPPNDEQDFIATFLDRETIRVDSIISQIHLSIDLMKEYRSALISSAVTGKMDVRQGASA